MATMEQKPAGVHTGPKTKVFKNFIGGEWVESRTGRTFENLNPADTREVVGIFQKSGKEDVDHAIETAKQAFKKWRLVPAPRRADPRRGGDRARSGQPERCVVEPGRRRFRTLT